MTQDERRAIRTAVFAILALAGLGMVGWLVWRGTVDAMAAMGLLAANLIVVTGYVAENVAQRIKAHAGPTGFDVEIGGAEEIKQAAAVVKDKAEAITEAVERSPRPDDPDGAKS